MLRLAMALLLGMTWASSLQAAGTSGEEIRLGREALMAGNPEQAKARFESVVGRPDVSKEDRYAALIGLGRSELWLGEYALARRTFEQAGEIAHDGSESQVAAAGLAKALNALDYPHQALAVALPYAKGSLESSLEVLKAQRSLETQDDSPAVLADLQAVNAPGRSGVELDQLRKDVSYALSNRVEGGFMYQHDSDDLTNLGLNLGASIPVHSLSPSTRLGFSAHTWRLDDGTHSSRVSDFDLDLNSRLGADGRLDLAVGRGNSGSWNFALGHAAISYRPSDALGLSFSAQREAILTPVAVTNQILADTYSLGTSLRLSDHWFFSPSYYHQNFTDGNRRDGGVARVTLSPYDIADTATALGASLYLRIFHSSLPGTATGYFNPANFHEELLSLTDVYRVSPNWRLRSTLGAGNQTVDGASNPIYSADIYVEGRVAGNARLTGKLGRSSVASTSGGGSGYWNDYIFLNLSFPF
jgi:tetratricopeptide (TPR) repeat protein